MKSKKNTRAVTVGIFVVVAIIIFIVGVLALGGQRKTFANTITVKAIFDDVNGLQNGSNIWYEGVKIGTVKKIRFTENSLVEVLMDIEDRSKKYIHKDARAKIGSEGLIGNKIVVIYGGTKNYPGLAEGDILEVDRALSMDEMMNTLQSNNKNLNDITANFKIISKRLFDGQGSIGKLLADESLFNEMQNTIATLRRASLNAQQLTSNISGYTAMLHQKGSLANELVTDTVVYSKLRSAVTRMDELSNTANQVVANLNEASYGLNKGLNDTSSAAGVLLHDPVTANYLKVTIKNLQSGSRKLDEDLEALQHNFLLRGFFKKKEKATTGN